MADASRRHPTGASPDIHLNLNVRGSTESATLRINERCGTLLKQGKQVFKLGLGQSPFPVPRVIVEELRANAHQKDYLPVRGLDALREAVADYHRRTEGIDVTGEDVLVGPGSKELMFILQLVYYGDLVIPTPSWVSYAPQAQIIGRQIRWIKTRPDNKWRLMPDELDRLCQTDPSRPRIVIVNYPSNPTGVSYTSTELQALADVARHYRVVLLSDEIYGELNFQGHHHSIARYYPEGTIISGGLSKWCGAGGWRLGTFTFPRELRWLQDAMAVVASETYTATSAPIQFAAVRAFTGGIEIEEYLSASRRVLEALGHFVWQELDRANVRVTEPEGAFYLFPDFSPYRKTLLDRGIATSGALCERLLADTGVALLPGEAFGRPAEELTARLAYVDFDGSRTLFAAQQLPKTQSLDRQFLTNYCPKIVAAVGCLVNWLQK